MILRNIVAAPPALPEPDHIGYTFRSLVLSSFPVRKPPADRTVWSRSGDGFKFHLAPEGAHGIPYGEDRMILFLLATKAVVAHSAAVNLGTAYQILRMFGQAPDGRNYQRLADRMNRIFSMTVSFEGLVSKGDAPVPFQKTTRISYDHDLWFMTSSAGKRAYSFENRTTLAPAFWAELLNFPLPVDLRVVRLLLDSPANLDFYVWLINKAFSLRLGRYLKVPIVGPRSVSDQLAAGRYAEPRNFRTKIKKWLERTKDLWPACPAALSDDGTWLIVGHAAAVHHPQAIPFLTGRRARAARV